MGHIVNAKGMRLGWVSNWCDQWFSELQFYPEYLHSIYRIRFFLIYFFNMHALEQRGFFFSHFDIIKIYKNLKINIFYYDGQGESLYTDMIFDYTVAVLRDIDNDDPETKVWEGLFEPLKILIIFNLLFEFNMLEWNSDIKKYIMKALSSGNMRYIKHIFINNILYYNKECNILLSKYVFFLFYFFNKNLYKKTNLYSRCYLEAVLKRFFFILAGFDWMYTFFIYVSEILMFILSILNPYFKLYTSFYAISNNCVNAKFLSRFIARKFAQNYGFYELINPIRRELRVVCKETKGSYGGVFFNKLKDRIDFGKIKIYRKSLFKSFLTYLFINFNKYSFKFFNKNFTWFSLNMLYIYIWMNNTLISINKLITFSIKYYLRRSAFSYFFSGNFKNHIKIFNRFFYPNKNAVMFFLPKINFTGFFNYIYEDFITNKNIIFINILILNKNMSYFRYAQHHFNRYMQYNFWMYNDGLFFLTAKYNILKRRILKPKKGGLFGFKMQCSGRFTRRQRASSIWFSYGSTPLNTIKERIDYSFFSIPISNSKITIKVWLHLNNTYPNWYFKLL